MKITFTEASWSDYLWLQENDKKLLKRVNLLLKGIIRNPFDGIGKPEPLKANFKPPFSSSLSMTNLMLLSSMRSATSRQTLPLSPLTYLNQK